MPLAYLFIYLLYTVFYFIVHFSLSTLIPYNFDGKSYFKILWQKPYYKQVVMLDRSRDQACHDEV